MSNHYYMLHYFLKYTIFTSLFTCLPSISTVNVLGNPQVQQLATPMFTIALVAMHS